MGFLRPAVLLAASLLHPAVAVREDLDRDPTDRKGGQNLGGYDPNYLMPVRPNAYDPNFLMPGNNHMMPAVTTSDGKIDHKQYQSESKSNECSRCRDVADYEGNPKNASRLISNNKPFSIIVFSQQGTKDEIECKGIEEKADAHLADKENRHKENRYKWVECLCVCHHEPAGGNLEIHKEARRS
mmetsp:Transcript_104621/g.207771  ORF Transcript_104621/g.207771 Transcript_104621/m.207771 type:complete len:184 (+) Transcript_104621:89-640(+)|eukprot:CAMPEP_0172832730 /NCGR_PEP_ID=MMETSP1075-20121228/23871_1 /TAXON_ID=2916 /ORGANISM="Ceratium fusus, Strain PA161109" /LENGTH=183 /DNA_ID=CAMNT_0013675381 /DNA_START=81 /DNA_END=632 /DNA_ORIENTATION=-